MLQSITWTQKDIREFAKGFAINAGDDYEQKVLSSVLADLRSEANALLRAQGIDPKGPQGDHIPQNLLRDMEYKAMLRIWLDAITARTARFVPLQFPVHLSDSQNVSPASPTYIQAKIQEVFNKFREDLIKQTQWANKAIAHIMENSANNLPKCELDAISYVINDIDDHLEDVESDIEQQEEAYQQQWTGKQPASIKDFWSEFKV